MRSGCTPEDVGWNPISGNNVCTTGPPQQRDRASLGSGTGEICGFHGARSGRLVCGPPPPDKKRSVSALFQSELSEEEFDCRKKGSIPRIPMLIRRTAAVRRSLKDTLIRAVRHTLDIRDAESTKTFPFSQELEDLLTAAPERKVQIARRFRVLYPFPGTTGSRLSPFSQ